MGKRGKANGGYGRLQRALNGTLNDVIDGQLAHEEEMARVEKEKLVQAISTIDTFLGHCFDEESMREMRPKAADALDLLRELVKGTEISFL